MSSRFKKALRGFTLIELMIAISIIVILTAIAIPNIRAYRKNSLGAKCNGNLHAVQVAVLSYAMMNNLAPSSPVPLESITTFLTRKNLTSCPMGGDYVIKNWWPQCMNREQVALGSGISSLHWVPIPDTSTPTN